MASDDTYLDLAVGPYALALAARHVIAIHQDIVFAASIEVGGSSVRLRDLAHAFLSQERATIPFLIVVEDGKRMGGIGVDRVGHLRHGETTSLLHVPTLGLDAPRLLSGGIRHDHRLLLVLDPAALVDFVYAQLETPPTAVDPSP